MTTRDIIVIGASAGGVEALMTLVRGLPSDFPAALFVVLHVPATSESKLPHILMHAGCLPAVHGTDGSPIRSGTITVAPPDHHLIVERGIVRITRGPQENRHRPAADVLFRSAAHAYGPRVIGIVLSGNLDDGSAGLVAIHRGGGKGIVQAPDDALFTGMPTNAIAVDPEYILPVADIPSLLVQLVHEEVHEQEAVSDRREITREVRIAEFNMHDIEGDSHPGTPSPFGCPDCGGVLWEVDDGSIKRYRCRVGHAYSPATLLVTQSERLEAALWAALRGLEEKAALSRRLAAHAQNRAHERSAAGFTAQADEAEAQARLIQQMLTDSRRLSIDDALEA